MYNDLEREIDLIDLFFYWLSHWKSFVAVILAALLISGGAFLVFGPKGVQSDSTVDKSSETVGSFDTTATDGEDTDSSDDASLSAFDTLQALEDEYDIDFSQADTLTDKDIDIFFDYALTYKDIKAVDDLMQLYSVYSASYDSYQEAKDTLTAAEAAEVGKNLSATYSHIVTTRGSLTACQKAYLSYKLDEKVDLTDAISEIETQEASREELESTEEKSQEADGSFTFTGKTFCIILAIAIILHILVVCMFYVLNDKIKSTEPVAAMLDISELGRFAATDISAIAISDIAAKKAVDSLGLVDINSTEQALALSAACTNLATTVLKASPSTASDMEALCSLKAAVILVTVGQTKFADLCKTVDMLRVHQVEVLGLIIN